MWTPLHAKIHITLRQRQLLPKKQRLLVAVSGGQDSLCLGKLLLDLQSKWHWEIAIAHCDHGWPTDRGMAAHVENLAKTWQVPFYLKSVSHLKQTEAAAREWRYQALIEIATEKGFSYLVTAHTQSDRAETLLYNLIRGSGGDGLSALSWRRYLTPNLLLVRPLLEVSRADTYQFCQQFNLPIWEDILNENLGYARNRIRLELIPYLQAHFNRQIEKALGQTSELLKSEAEYLETLADSGFEESMTPDQSALNRLKLRDFPLAIQRRIIRKFLKFILCKDPNFEQIEAVVGLIDAPNKARISSLPGGIILEVQGEFINHKPYQ